MKMFIFSICIMLSMTGFSFASNCVNGFCSRPVGRIVSSTRVVAKEIIQTPRRVVSNCVNGRCNSRVVNKTR
jgi:hypothetical protein